MSTSGQSPTASEPISSSTTSTHSTVYDLICIGFGPAQVATAIANREAVKPATVLFLERKPSFSWHSKTHASRTRMKTPFVYDLVTTRNPRSAFSYVNYLLVNKRLVEFANSDRLSPLRMEFEDYVGWCAEQFKEQVQYSSEAVEVVPDMEENTVSAWKIIVRNKNGLSSVMRARSIVAPSPVRSSTTRQQPLTSIDFLAGQRIISMEDYLTKRNALWGLHEPRLNIAVVGSGRQTAEILNDLLSCSRLGNITVVTDDKSLAPLQMLSQQKPPQIQLCSIWAKSSYKQKESVTEAPELIRAIYSRAYEKQVASKGHYSLRVVREDTAEPFSKSDLIIRDTVATLLPSTKLLQSLDPLALGCQSKGDSLEEVSFKSGMVAEDSRIFLMSTRSGGGRSLSKDIALMAGHVVNALSPLTERRRNGVVAQARM
ncbi:L-lysine 6-monooxygenase (NADPH-requiring)-domain-containing protein [Phaeosphaeriaceae sp. PMI808]|nr:L-lysine 6-monooxygenase (NADPH-requiring)-domain-containing protein [Phaeosphaeriaceae sp. PMI808]